MYCHLISLLCSLDRGFFHLPGFSQTEWATFKNEQDKLRQPLKKWTFIGTDTNAQAIKASARNLSRLEFTTSQGKKRKLKFSYLEFQDLSFKDSLYS